MKDHPPKRPVDAGGPYQPDERARGVPSAVRTCGDNRSRVGLVGPILMAAYSAVHTAHLNAPRACGVLRSMYAAWRRLARLRGLSLACRSKCEPGPNPFPSERRRSS